VPGLFHSLTIRGQAGTLVWAGRDAARLGAWTIWKQEQARGRHSWHLSARVLRADAFQCRQTPLLFTAPHAKGRWCWGIETLEVLGDQLQAVLGQPLQ
jgi:hypothetical protein